MIVRSGGFGSTNLPGFTKSDMAVVFNNDDAARDFLEGLDAGLLNDQHTAWVGASGSVGPALIQIKAGLTHPQTSATYATTVKVIGQLQADAAQIDTLQKFSESGIQCEPWWEFVASLLVPPVAIAEALFQRCRSADHDKNYRAAMQQMKDDLDGAPTVIAAAYAQDQAAAQKAAQQAAAQQAAAQQAASGGGTSSTHPVSQASMLGGSTGLLLLGAAGVAAYFLYGRKKTAAA